MYGCVIKGCYLIYLVLLFLFSQLQINTCCQAIVKYQGSNGIRQWPIKWCTSPLLIHKIVSSVDNNYGLKRLDSELDKPTNQNPLKVSKVVKPTDKKTLLYKQLW